MRFLKLILLLTLICNNNKIYTNAVDFIKKTSQDSLKELHNAHNLIIDKYIKKLEDYKKELNLSKEDIEKLDSKIDKLKKLKKNI